MGEDSKLMKMLTGYAAAHQHPFNVAVHLIGIPTIMLGVFIPLSWFAIEIGPFTATLAHLVLFATFLFYMTLDKTFALVFLIFGFGLAALALKLSGFGSTSTIIAAACFFGGYLAQFVGHAVEKSMPVLVHHPIQANLAAPFFTVVEIFHLIGLRGDLFDSVKAQVERQRQERAGTA